jgi:hypothetical protein
MNINQIIKKLLKEDYDIDLKAKKLVPSKDDKKFHDEMNELNKGRKLPKLATPVKGNYSADLKNVLLSIDNIIGSSYDKTKFPTKEDLAKTILPEIRLLSDKNKIYQVYLKYRTGKRTEPEKDLKKSHYHAKESNRLSKNIVAIMNGDSAIKDQEAERVIRDVPGFNKIVDPKTLKLKDGFKAIDVGNQQVKENGDIKIETINPETNEIINDIWELKRSEKGGNSTWLNLTLNGAIKKFKEMFGDTSVSTSIGSFEGFRDLLASKQGDLNMMKLIVKGILYKAPLKAKSTKEQVLTIYVKHASNPEKMSVSINRKKEEMDLFVDSLKGLSVGKLNEKNKRSFEIYADNTKLIRISFSPNKTPTTEGVNFFLLDSFVNNITTKIEKTSINTKKFLKH